MNHSTSHSGLPKERVSEVALSQEETNEFSNILEETIVKHGKFFQNGFIAESPDKLRKIVAYYNAVNGHGDYPKLKCNALVCPFLASA